MGVAALILGILALLICIIPLIGFFGLIFAIVGLILGIIDWSQKKKKGEKHGQAKAGVICSSIAIIIVIIYAVLFGIFVVNTAKSVSANGVGKAQEFIDSVKDMSDGNLFDFAGSLNIINESNIQELVSAISELDENDVNITTDFNEVFKNIIDSVNEE